MGDELVLENIKDIIANGGNIILKNKTTGDEFELVAEFSDRDRDMLVEGGLLNYTKNRS